MEAMLWVTWEVLRSAPLECLRALTGPQAGEDADQTEQHNSPGESDQASDHGW